MSIRTYSHIIDTKAVRQVLNILPEYWVVRELTERDYGIDLMIEVFAENGKDSKGHDSYAATGYICYLQIKGTGDKKYLKQSKGKISYSIEKKSLLYIEKFATPFLLLRVCTSEEKKEIYFLWLQRYISDVLDISKKNWRDNQKGEITLHIPASNKIPDFNNFKKIEKIAWRIKYIEEYSEFYELYTTLVDTSLGGMINLSKKFTDFKGVLDSLYRILYLSTLLSKNNCCINKQSVLDLIQYIEEVRDGKKIPKEKDDYPHNFNFELLKTSNMSFRFIEEFEAENDDNTIY
jgi:hypothetical protein